MNFFRFFWPKLLKPPQGQIDHETSPFLSFFGTPLLKVTKRGSKAKALAFYSMAEYNLWRSEIGDDDISKWTIKYYKGLGTSTAAEAKEYFAAFDNHFRPYQWKSDVDGELLDMVFDKKRAADRKEWILDEYNASSTIETNADSGNYSVSYEDFVNKEMIHFSHADNIRSIPSVIDGLKPSQRKVLFACFKRNLRSEMKVAQLAGYCSEQTAYHHGETVRPQHLVAL
jgi:DNA topoisomerase II